MSASESEMNVPTAGQKNLVIVGATGMVGGYAFRYMLDHPAVGHVTSVGRRPVGISHPKLIESSSRLRGLLGTADALKRIRHGPRWFSLDFL
jgi:hypothetical protein